MTQLELRGVSKAFGAVTAVAGAAFDLSAGGRMAIVGPSGCGKTTLLRLVAGFESPDRGSIALDGRMLADGTTSVPAFRRGIGYLPQDGALFPHLTVADNIGFGLETRGRARQTRIAALMALVSLDSALLKRWPHELSGGQQQRVALARALAREPRLILLDEPFSALDTNLRATTRRAVIDVLDRGKIATILVTHDHAEALSFADTLAVMRDGRILQQGRPSELFARPRDAFTAQFLGDAVLLDAELAEGGADCVLGRIAVDDTQQRGRGRIMFRPEQLRLSFDGREGQAGTIAAIDYTGHVCTATVKLTAGPDLLLVRCATSAPPTIGQSVWVSAQAPAHVLAET